MSRSNTRAASAIMGDQDRLVTLTSINNKMSTAVAGAANPTSAQVVLTHGSTGSALVPMAVDASGVVQVDGTITTLAAERKSYVGYVQSAIVANQYILLIDRDNSGGQWPHSQNGSMNVDAVSAKVTFSGATLPGDATLRLGVVTRIDGTDADVQYLQTYRFQAQANDGQYIFHNFQPSCLSFNQSAGKLVGALTNDFESNLVAVNTATALTSPGGSVAPGLGDVILKIQYHSDTYNIAVGVLYHSV